MRVLRLWHEGRPEIVILIGTLTGLVANTGALAIGVGLRGAEVWPVTVAVFGGGIGLATLAVLILALRGSRTSRNFASVAAVATFLTVLSVAGLIGGTITLVGATWGMVDTYKSRP